MVTLQKYAFATFTSTAIFFICSIGMACTKKDEFSTTSITDTTTSTPIIPVSGSSKTMLALGDSYTIGQNVTETERFPNQTIALLNNHQMNIAYPSTIVAITGWTTRNLLDGIANAKLANTYDVVTLLIGVNNQYQHVDTNTYKTEFPQLLQQAIGFAKDLKSHVFVLSIPDYSVTPFADGRSGIAADIAHYNAMCKTMTEQMGVAFVDITPISQMAATDQSLTASDGLHPSGKQYALWAAVLWPKVYGVLK